MDDTAALVSKQLELGASRLRSAAKLRQAGVRHTAASQRASPCPAAGAAAQAGLAVLLHSCARCLYRKRLCCQQRRSARGSASQTQLFLRTLRWASSALRSRTRWPCRSNGGAGGHTAAPYNARLPMHRLLSGWRSAQPYQMVVPQQAAAVQQAAATQAAATAAPAAPSAAGQTLPSAARPAGAAVLFEYHCVGVQNYTSRAGPLPARTA